MRCEEAILWLSAYLDRDLPFDKREELKKHLEHCTECQEKLKDLERTRLLLARAKNRSFKAPTGLLARVMKEVRRERIILRRRGRILRGSIAAALFGISAGIIAWLKMKQKREG